MPRCEHRRTAKKEVTVAVSKAETSSSWKPQRQDATFLCDDAHSKSYGKLTYDLLFCLIHVGQFCPSVKLFSWEH